MKKWNLNRKFLLMGLIPFSSVVLTTQAQANLLERIQLEEMIRQRIERAVQVKDPRAQVFVKFDYQSIALDMPGLAVPMKSVMPSQVEDSDIQKAEIEIYSELNSLPEEIKKTMNQLVPISQNRVKVSLKKLEALKQDEKYQPVQPQDLNKITEKAIKDLSDKLFMMTGLGIFVFAGMFFYFSLRRSKEFKEQLSTLAKAILENGAGGASMAPMPLPQASQNLGAGTGGSLMDGQSTDNPFVTISNTALLNLFADCYWSQEDEYAHWIWKKVSNEQKNYLFKEFAPLKEYSMYFIQCDSAVKNYHQHPYYLTALKMYHVSNEDVAAQIISNPELWHSVSPLRQAHLKLPLDKKVQAIQTQVADNNQGLEKLVRLPASALRQIKGAVSWGEISVEEERTLLTNPKIIPAEMRGQIRSLVWLSQRDDQYIQKVLAKFDARTLALAWIGPEEVLQKFEAQMPDKKQKLLKTYCEKSTPSRQSAAYQSLVEEGLRAS